MEMNLKGEGFHLEPHVRSALTCHSTDHLLNVLKGTSPARRRERKTMRESRK